MTEHHGTRAELIDEIMDKCQDWAFRRWADHWMKHQAKLKITTFDPKKEIVILTDYAAVYEMKGKDLRTCEHGPTCNQLVALVLHSPEPQADCAGPERNVQCDYWRFWSNEKGNAEQHDMAMREIAEFYKFGGPRPGKEPQGSVTQGRARRGAQIPDLGTLSVYGATGSARSTRASRTSAGCQFGPSP